MAKQRSMTIRRLATCLVGSGLLACGLTGCGPGGPGLGQVSGTVTSDGEPVPNVSIEFFPTQGRPSMARTDGEGRFVAYYMPKQPGAQPGTHRLEYEFAAAGPEDVSLDGSKRRGKKPQGKLSLQPSEIEVVEGQENVFELKLVAE